LLISFRMSLSSVRSPPGRLLNRVVGTGRLHHTSCAEKDL